MHTHMHAQGYLNFLHSGNMDDYWSHLEGNNITREALATMDHPITGASWCCTLLCVALHGPVHCCVVPVVCGVCSAGTWLEAGYNSAENKPFGIVFCCRNESAFGDVWTGHVCNMCATDTRHHEAYPALTHL